MATAASIAQLTPSSIPYNAFSLKEKIEGMTSKGKEAYLENLLERVNAAFQGGIYAEDYKRFEGTEAFDSFLGDQTTTFLTFENSEGSPVAGIVYQTEVPAWLNRVIDSKKEAVGPEFDSSTFGYFGTLWVSKELRGQGLACKIIEKVEGIIQKTLHDLGKEAQVIIAVAKEQGEGSPLTRFYENREYKVFSPLTTDSFLYMTKTLSK